MTSQSNSINSTFVSILIESQIEIEIRISKKRKVNFTSIFQKLKNKKMQIFIFQKINFLNYTFHARIIIIYCNKSMLITKIKSDT